MMLIIITMRNLILKRFFGNGEGFFDIGWDSDDEEFDLEKRFGNREGFYDISLIVMMRNIPFNEISWCQEKLSQSQNHCQYTDKNRLIISVILDIRHQKKLLQSSITSQTLTTIL